MENDVQQGWILTGDIVWTSMVGVLTARPWELPWIPIESKTLHFSHYDLVAATDNSVKFTWEWHSEFYICQMNIWKGEDDLGFKNKKSNNSIWDAILSHAGIVFNFNSFCVCTGGLLCHNWQVSHCQTFLHCAAEESLARPYNIPGWEKNMLWFIDISLNQSQSFWAALSAGPSHGASVK